MSALGRAAHRASSLAILMAGVSGLTGLCLALGGLDDVVARGLIYMVMVIGLSIFTSNSGVLSFGHVSFVAIGAYIGAILTIPTLTKDFLLPDLPGFLAGEPLPGFVTLLIAMGCCALLALVAGAPLMRLSGLAAGIATLSGLVIVYTVLRNYDELTGGTGTLGKIPVTVGTGTALVGVLIALVVAHLFSSSRTGLRLKASREDLVAAEAMGVKVERDRLRAFVLSAMVMGASGWLLAHYLGSITPDSFYISLTFLLIAMLVIGGLTSLSGAVVGTVLLTAITEVFQRLEDAGTTKPGTQYLAVSILLIVILALRPRGLTDGRDLALPAKWFRSRADQAHPPAQPARSQPEPR